MLGEQLVELMGKCGADRGKEALIALSIVNSDKIKELFKRMAYLSCMRGIALLAVECL